MKILVISQYFSPDITAAAFRIGETAGILSQKGHQVTVVTSKPHRAGNFRGDPVQSGEMNSNLVIHRVPVDPLGGGGGGGGAGGGMRSYLYHFFSFVFRARRKVKQLVRAGYRPDVIWCSSPPLFVGLIGVAAARWSSAPLVLDIRDIWPDTAVAAGQLSRGGMAYRLGRTLERYLYRRAAAVTCVAAPMAEYLRREGPAAMSVTVVYNGASMAADAPLPADEVKKTVLYAGNLGRLQGIDMLITAWSRLDEALRKDWQLEIIGGGVVEDDLQDLAKTLGVTDSVTFRGVLTKEDTVQETRRAGTLFLSLIPNPVFDLTIPSKLFDYLAAGRPIIGGISGEGAMVLRELPGNYVFTPGGANDLDMVLGTALSAVEWSEPLAANGRAAQERFSRVANVQTLEQVLTTVVAK